ncbi:MAG: acetyl-CoA C-acyltransferase [Chitinophagales bacterium]|jgi:acetyl-CoA acyltransferase|nr:acetyl-CoA C-acyltransferase [Chitinophagales bacterium]MBP9220874.1 acetyl-CoA C-acyltransferase [Chitinophagales bacterium]MBP9797211.1 acetyl-CoA C-acyltransferase [Chitinophagales bacterium]
MTQAYIVAGLRTAVGKAPRGLFRFTRPDDLAVELIRQLLLKVPQLDPVRVDDLIVGNAVPEAEQGLQIGRMISVRALPITTGGMTVNRYCASGVETISIAVAKIKAGMADCIIAGGVESMSLVPTAGWKVALNYETAKTHPDYYIGMGLTAENVARDFNISREDADNYSFNSHKKAINAIDNKLFADGIAPIEVTEIFVNEKNKRSEKKYTVDTDEGPRRDTSIEALNKLKPVFAANGVVTAGNSSQTSDGASFVIVMSEKMVKELNLQPIARMVSCATVGVEPRIMGIGPVAAIPKALKMANLKLEDIDLIELNEAFAAQALAVIREAHLNPDIVNINGGGVALGHPLGCTGTKLTVQILNDLKRLNKKYGMVTACVGGGQGIAGIYERLN